MNLVAITALIAVCGAAKLDRTYLPPASAPTAGGSPGALQTPFAASRSSFNGNNGLGGIPKGSYENEFQGVVVDAAAAGTRASGVEASGLGAPRISYGSTDSRVGAAAFKTRPSAFAQPQNDESGFQQSQGQFAGQVSGSQGFQGSATQGFQSAAQGSSQGQFSANAQGEERPRAAIDRAAGILRYENEVGPEGYHYAFETDNGITAEENGVASNGVQAQGGFSYTGDDGQVYSVSYMADEGGYRPKGDHLPTPPPIPVEILKSLEQNARDEAAGLSDDGSYDAQKYNAGSDYSESDGANGKIHQSSRFGGEFDATASGTFISQSNQPFGRPGQRGQSGQKAQVGQFGQLGQKGQVTQFGQSTSNAQSDDTSGADEQSTDLGATDASGQGANGQSGSGFSGQFGQSSNRGTSANRGAGRFGQSSTQGQATFGSSNSNVNGANGNEQSGSSFSGQFGQSNRFQSSNRGSQSGRFGQTGSSSQGQANRFGSNASSQTRINGLGNREYLPPLNKPSQNVRPQNGRPANGRPQVANKAPETSQDTEEPKKDDEASADFVPLAQQDLQSESRPQGAFTSFGKPITTQNGFDSSEKKPTNGRRPSANGNNNFAQSQSSQSENRFGEPNAYLPPSSNGNRRPGQNSFQSNTASQFNQQTQRPQTSFASGSQSAFATQSQSGLGSETEPTFATQPQQTNGFQRPQSTRPGQLGNRFGSADQSSSSFVFNKPVKATAQPDTELTTPFETSNDETSASQSAQSTTSGLSSASRPTSGRPAQPSFGGQFNNAQSSFGSQSSSRPQGTTSRPFGQPSAFPTQPPNQFNQNSQFGSQSQSSFGQNSDAQFASSTQRPTYTQQPQGPDNSYYYNQPSEPFGTPQGSRFPSAPSNQFTGVNQQTSFSQSQFSGSSEDEPAASNLPSSLTQGSSKYPQPPTIAPVVGGQSQFAGQFQGSSKYPRPPTVQTPTGPSSSQALFQGNGVNGVTQASISSFPTQTPIQTSQFENRFGSRPSFQQSQTSQFEQSQTSQSSSSRPTQPSFGQQSTSSFSQSNNFQGQAQSFGQQTQENEAGADKPEQPVATQQYNGEIYEYNKPAQTLPPPDSTPAPSSGSFAQKVQGQGQFGAQSSRPQFGQTNDEEDQRPISQFGGQASTAVSRPQFGVSRPQSGQNSFGAEPSQTPEDSKPYGALAQRFGQPSASRPQFGGQTGPQFGQTQTSFEANTDDETQKESSQSDTQASCCKTLPSFDRNPQGQNQFSQNFPGAQTFKPEPTSSFANKGEHFGGPRPPPSFDEETGYHY